MLVICAEDCQGKGVQRLETQLKVQQNCYDKTSFALHFSTAPVVIIQHVQVESSLLLSGSVPEAEGRE